MNNKTSDKNVAEDRVIAHKFAVMQQQLEQKDKRIQELEGENVIQRRQLNSAFDNGYILHTYKIRKLIANETIDISGFKCIAV